LKGKEKKDGDRRETRKERIGRRGEDAEGGGKKGQRRTLKVSEEELAQSRA